jgi:hypothetical protein
MAEDVTGPKASRSPRLLILARVLLALQAAILIVWNVYMGVVLTLLSFIVTADAPEAQRGFWAISIISIIVVLASCVVGPAAFVLTFRRRWWAPVLIATAEILIIFESLFLGFSSAHVGDAPLWPFLAISAVPILIGVLVTAPANTRRYFSLS